MLLTRTIVPAKQTDSRRDRNDKKPPALEEFLSKNDWSGALGPLHFQKSTDLSGTNRGTLTMWMVYCAFHLGNYKKSIAVSKFLSNLYIPI
jgi:intraflagellar transport protein 56